MLRRGGSEVLLGNLLSLPVGGGMLYVEPVYVQAAEGGYPLLRKVLVAFGNKVGFSDTLELSLQQVFGAGTNVSQPQPPGDGTTTTPTVPLTELEQAIADASRAYADGVEALKNNDFTAYGDAQRRLQEALNRAAELSAAAAAANGEATPAEPTPTAEALPAGEESAAA